MIADRRLGRLKSGHDSRDLMSTTYMAAVAEPPAIVDYGKAVESWPMYDNNSIGDCTIAAVGHQIEVWTANAQGKTSRVATRSVVKRYSEVSGYVPGDPSTDVGATERAVLKNWLKKPSTTANVKRPCKPTTPSTSAPTTTAVTTRPTSSVPSAAASHTAGSTSTSTTTKPVATTGTDAIGVPVVLTSEQSPQGEAPEALARTGSDLLWWAYAGGLFIVFGVLVLYIPYRRRSEAEPLGSASRRRIRLRTMRLRVQCGAGSPERGGSSGSTHLP